MRILGTLFPGFPDVNLGRSQRSYSYDPADSVTVQDTHAYQVIEQTADNITYRTPFGVFSPAPPTHGNVRQSRLYHGSRPEWFGVWFSNDWNDLRANGIAYGTYAPHLPPQQAIPAWKLYEPGSGFVLPATFLGQPLTPKVRPPGS
jgi:hypothetical protein